MSDPPRIADQLQTIIDLLRQSTAETHKRLSQIESVVNNKKIKPYKYQMVIDYLKQQGVEDNTEIVALDKNCLNAQEAISVLQELIKEQSKTKCLTKEDLVSFFKKPTPIISNLEPPFRK